MIDATKLQFNPDEYGQSAFTTDNGINYRFIISQITPRDWEWYVCDEDKKEILGRGISSDIHWAKNDINRWFGHNYVYQDNDGITHIVP